MKKLVLILALALSLMAEMSFDQVQELIKNRQYSKALVSLEVIQVNHPDESIVYYAQAQAKAGFGDLRGAKSALDKAKSLNPKLTYAKPEAVKALEIAVQPRTELVQTFEREDKPTYWIVSFIGFVILFGIIYYYFMFRKKPEEIIEQPKPYEYKSTTAGYSTPAREHSTVPVDAPSEQETMKRYLEDYRLSVKTNPSYNETFNTQSAGKSTVKNAEVHHHYHHNSNSGNTVAAGLAGVAAGVAVASIFDDTKHSTQHEVDNISRVYNPEPEDYSWSSSNSSSSDSWSSSNSSSDDSWSDSSSSSSSSSSSGE